MKECSLYLKNYEALWREDPKAANMQWFKDEKYGLFILKEQDWECSL